MSDMLVECEHVTKYYGKITAVNDVSFSIEEGEIFGLVGPNGAGKTTLIEMIESLRVPDSGSIKVLGYNPVKEARQLQEGIGVQLQSSSIQPNIKVKEAIILFASLYKKPLANPEVLLKRLSLEDKAYARYAKLSGGQKQRLAIALALVNNPPLLFFDEISTGLDPQARRNMWELVEDLRAQEKTIFLTTHYMEEAEELCDRVAVIDHGKIIALDSPQNLIKNAGIESKVIFRIIDKDISIGEFKSIPLVSRAERIADDYILHTKDGTNVINKVISLSEAKNFKIVDIRTRSPNLDDVFLELTGKELRE